MTYFSDHGFKASLVREIAGRKGLRTSQLGALHSLLAHYTLSSESALVTMPTGTGKTAVLMLLPYYLESRRVLILTPSRAVRGQIAEDLATLKTLKDLGVVPQGLPEPTVTELKTEVTTDTEWEALKAANVVVATPNVISPSITGKELPSPPDDLFDLVIVDEAHHAPARTWSAVLNHFTKAKKALFTATPFRRDRKEIPGVLIYNYPLSRAQEEGVFGEIEYVPVPARDGEVDQAIATRAEDVYRRDKEAGLNHKLMVRTDSITRAQELTDVYADTTLKLALVHSRHSYQHVKSVLHRLERDELDGIICVDMLGEGFNFPTLKIAAIHSPHKSLSVTLQFIGRFARTAGKNLGSAKFLAVPSEIVIESERLYDEGASWQRLVRNLSETRVNEEVQIRQALQTFTLRENNSTETEDLSLYSLTPSPHVKIFHASIKNLDRPLNFPKPMEVIHREFSAEHNTVVVVTREEVRPDWTRVQRFAKVTYDLFLLYYDPSGLLFICASRRNDGLYESLASQLSTTLVRRLTLSRINKALLGLEAANFFSVGMRNRVPTSTSESYRMVAGSQAQKSITRSDAKFYHRGHIFGTAIEGGKPVTLGISSSSKLWSTGTMSVPVLIQWCRNQANKINNPSTPKTGSELDWLQTGREITEIPSGVVGADWDPEVYLYPPTVRYVDDNGEYQSVLLSEFSLSVTAGADPQTVGFAVHHEEYTWRGQFCLKDGGVFLAEDSEEHQPVLVDGDSTLPLLSHLNLNPLQFYFSDLASMIGNQYFDFVSTDTTPLDQEQIISVDWAQEQVDPKREFGATKDGRKSIHEFLASSLSNVDHDVVIYDHGTGEVADFIAVKDYPDENKIEYLFYHCKGSGGEAAGDRVNDVYEVCGQAIKCLIWINRNDHLERKLFHRLKTRKGKSRFLKGDDAKLRALIGASKSRANAYQMVIVQPGISKSDLEDKLAYNLGAVSEYLVKQHCLPLAIIASR